LPPAVPSFQPNQTIATSEPTISVDAGLAPGRHRFQLEVFDSAGRRSTPDVVTIEVARIVGPVGPLEPVRPLEPIDPVVDPVRPTEPVRPIGPIGPAPPIRDVRPARDDKPKRPPRRRKPKE
jgi:hypothetical protein